MSKPKRDPFAPKTFTGRVESIRPYNGFDFVVKIAGNPEEIYVRVEWKKRVKVGSMISMVCQLKSFGMCSCRMVATKIQAV
jgi:hypothetical protein